MVTNLERFIAVLLSANIFFNYVRPPAASDVHSAFALDAQQIGFALDEADRNLSSQKCFLTT